MFDSLAARFCLVLTLGLIAYRVDKHAPQFSSSKGMEPGAAIITLSIAAILNSLVEEFVFRNWLPRLLACGSAIESRLVTALVYAAVRTTIVASPPLDQWGLDVLHFVLSFLLGCILPPFSMMESTALGFCYNMLAALPRL